MSISSVRRGDAILSLFAIKWVIKICPKKEALTLPFFDHVYTPAMNKELIFY
jgi:hypothetical protein